MVGAGVGEMIGEICVAMEFGASRKTSPAPATPTRR
jgi:pyruvate/2-oxoglutarate dehydrogenase complex dihydrolipoamide dehydrogenase (E3) component